MEKGTGDLDELRTSVRHLSDQRRAELIQLRRLKSEWQAAEIEQAACLEAQSVIRMVCATLQRSAHERIAAVVSRCLEAVFDDPYQFKIVFEVKRSRTEARLVFMDGPNEIDPLTASGGGVVDVAAFGLRVAALLLSRPAARRVLILDEPFRFVSAEYRPRLCTMIDQLSRELGLQFVYVTHQEELQMGTTIRLPKP